MISCFLAADSFPERNRETREGQPGAQEASHAA